MLGANPPRHCRKNYVLLCRTKQDQILCTFTAEIAYLTIVQQKKKKKNKLDMLSRVVINKETKVFVALYSRERHWT